MANNTLYYSTAKSDADRAMYQMDLTQGNPKVLIAVDKYDLFPMFVTGNILVVEAKPGFDFYGVEYWGVDTQSGQRLWKYSIKSTARFTYYTARPTSQAAFVLSCRDTAGCAWAVLDPQTGAASSPGSISNGEPVDITRGKDDTLYLVEHFTLYVINTLNGQTLYTWP